MNIETDVPTSEDVKQAIKLLRTGKHQGSTKFVQKC